MVRMKTLDSFFKRKRDESIDGEGQDLFDAPSKIAPLQLASPSATEEEVDNSLILQHLFLVSAILPYVHISG